MAFKIFNNCMVWAPMNQNKHQFLASLGWGPGGPCCASAFGDFSYEVTVTSLGPESGAFMGALGSGVLVADTSLAVVFPEVLL